MSRKVLAIKLRSMGDTVIMTAPLLELARVYPQAEIHVMVKEEWAPLLEGLPGVHRIWPYPHPVGKLSQSLGNLCLSREIRKENFDMVVNFHASPSSALMAWMAGVGTRSIHFHGHHAANRFSTVRIPGKGMLKPIIERDMDAVRALGFHIPAGRDPRIFLQTSEIQKATKTLDDLNLKSPVLGLSLGASRPTKCWPIERFASLAIEWCRQGSGGVLAFAGPHEQGKIQEFLKKVDDLLSTSLEDGKERAKIRVRIVATHELSLRSLAAVISQLSVLAGNDSGPKHVAVAVGTPTVTLFGPEHPFEWHPYARERHPYFFVDTLACRRDADPGMPAWCGLQVCGEEEHKCLRLIGVDSVLEECRRVSAKNP